MKHAFIYSDEKSNKFWTIEVTVNSYTVNYGKAGTTGQTQTKHFADEATCLKAAEKLIAEKQKKGYVEDNNPEAGVQTPKTTNVKKAITTPKAKEEEAPDPIADDGKEKAWHKEKFWDEYRYPEYDYFDIDAMTSGIKDVEDKAYWEGREMERGVIKNTSNDERDNWPLSKGARSALIFNNYDFTYKGASDLYLKVSRWGRLDWIAPLFEHLTQDDPGGANYKKLLQDGLECLLQRERLDIESVQWFLEQGADILNCKYSPNLEQFMLEYRKNADPNRIYDILASFHDDEFNKAIPQYIKLFENLNNQILEKQADKEKGIILVKPADFLCENSLGLLIGLGTRTLSLSLFRELNAWSHDWTLPEYWSGYKQDLAEWKAPEVDNILDYCGHYHISRKLIPQLKNLLDKGLFKDIFKDVFVIGIRTDETLGSQASILLTHVFNPLSDNELEAGLRLLETSEDWETNAPKFKLLVAQLIMKEPQGDKERALNILLRHLYSGHKQSEKIAYMFLRTYSFTSARWMYELARCLEANHIFDDLAETKVYRALTLDPDYKPTQALSERIKYRLYEQNKNVDIPAESVETEDRVLIRNKLHTWSQTPYDKAFTPDDLFLRTDNIIIRAYRYGEIHLRFLIEGEQGYAEALDFMNNILEKGYSVISGGWADKGFMLTVWFLHKPVFIKQMKKNVPGLGKFPATSQHAFFARAVQYAALRGKINHFAELALTCGGWDLELDTENNTIPGTFAVMALAFTDLLYMPLVSLYANEIDSDHSRLHATFPSALVNHYGICPEILLPLSDLICLNNHYEPYKVPKELIASPENMRIILEHFGFNDENCSDLTQISAREELIRYCENLTAKSGQSNLKTIRTALDTDSIEDKKTIIRFYNTYREALIEYEDGNYGSELSGVDESASEYFNEKLPPIMSVAEAKERGVAKPIESFDSRTCVFFAPTLVENFEHLAFVQEQWRLIDITNTLYEERRPGDFRHYIGDFVLKFKKWIVDSSCFACGFGLILFDGSNEPYVLYGLMNSLKTMSQFRSLRIKTKIDAEKLRLQHLKYVSPLRNEDKDFQTAAKTMDNIIRDLLDNRYYAAGFQADRIKKEDPAYAAATAILDYIKQDRPAV